MNLATEDRIKEALAKLKPALGGAEVRLVEVRDGVVTIRYYRPLTNPSACHVDRTKATRDIVLEVLEDVLREVMPELKEVILLDRG